MNDFSAIESELRKLQPSQPSSELFARVEQVLVRCREGVSPADGAKRRPGWWSLGVGLAATAVLLLLAQMNVDQKRHGDEKIALISPSSESVLSGNAGGSDVERSIPFNEFVPASTTQVVYNTEDEGLRFTDGSVQPLRQMRYQTREAWQWRNPATGASLRVSYPSEEIVLIPISGQ